MKKKLIREAKTISLSDLEGKINDIISKLADWRNEGWEGLDVDYYYESTTYDLYKHRLETDIEYNRRMYEEELLKSNRRKQYEKLKREFEND